MNERKRNLHREEVFIGNANESEVLVLFSLLFFFALVNTHAHTHTQYKSSYPTVVLVLLKETKEIISLDNILAEIDI